jgi:hypothetical protein
MSQNFKDAKLTYYNQDLQQTSVLVGMFLTTVTLTYTAITVDTTQNQTVSIKGLRTTSGTGAPPNINPGDIVLVQPQSTLGVGVSMAGAWVSAANTLSVSLASSATTTTPGAIVFDVLIFKFGQLDGLSS